VPHVKQVFTSHGGTRPPVILKWVKSTLRYASPKMLSHMYLHW